MALPSPDFSVKDRAVLITGSGRGIGLAVAKALAGGGAKVAVQDIDEGVARAETDAINAAGGRAVAVGGDLADVTQAEKIVGAATEAFGDLDVLINNGSIQSHGDFFSHTPERMRRELEANVLMPTRLCQLVLPAMRARRWGRIINFGSIQGKSGNPGMPAYAMSRAAMSNLSSGLGRTFGREGITVNCVAPGWMHTFRNAHDFKDEADKLAKGRSLPGGRIGEAHDLAGLCLLLCSRAGEYINGQTLHVDGGWSA